jgi:hypothetical protein
MPKPTIDWTDAEFMKANGSNEINCLELAARDGHIGLRDSKDPTGPVLTFTPGEMAAFVAGAKAGEFDRYTI